MSEPLEHSDAELMRRIARQDRQAFMAIYDRYASRAYGLALQMMRRPMPAEDVLQEAFLKVWTGAGSYRPERGTFLAWLLAITRYTALDHLRAESRRPIAAGSEVSKEALAVLDACPPMAGLDLASVVTTEAPYKWTTFDGLAVLDLDALAPPPEQAG